jgi:hypothetical protein
MLLGVIRFKMIWWVGHTANMPEKRRAFKILVEKQKGKELKGKEGVGVYESVILKCWFKK